MRDLKPQHRKFVQEFCKLKNATAAARKAGYKDNGTNSIRVMASQLMDRDDVSKAIVEETLRRLRASLPVHLGLVQEIAEGRTKHPDDQPISPAVRLKALELMTGAAGVGPTTRVEQEVRVEVTVRDRWERLARMAAARGEDPQTVLANLPEPERLAVMRAIEGPQAEAVDAEYEEVEEA